MIHILCNYYSVGSYVDLNRNKVAARLYMLLEVNQNYFLVLLCELDVAYCHMKIKKKMNVRHP